MGPDDALSQGWPSSTQRMTKYFVKDSPELAGFYTHMESGIDWIQQKVIISKQ
jgi:hypothetical protein